MNEQTDNNITVQVTHLESNTFDASYGKKPFDPLFERCRIHVHNKRKRLADPKGISDKACIDGIVVSGILPDDRAEYVKDISESQEKSKIEETIITIQKV
jgi:hypothetical protein